MNNFLILTAFKAKDLSTTELTSLGITLPHISELRALFAENPIVFWNVSQFSYSETFRPNKGSLIDCYNAFKALERPENWWFEVSFTLDQLKENWEYLCPSEEI